MSTEGSSSDSDSLNGYRVETTGIQITSSGAAKPGNLSVSGKTTIVTESEPGNSSAGISLSGVCDVSLGIMEGHASNSASGGGYDPRGNNQSVPQGSSIVVDVQEGANVSFRSDELICTANGAPGQYARVFQANPRSDLHIRAITSNMTAGQPTANPQEPQHRDQGPSRTAISQDGNPVKSINADYPRFDGTRIAIRLFEFTRYVFAFCTPVVVERIFTSIFYWFRK